MEIEGFGWGWRFALGHEETDATKVRPEAAEVDLPHNAVPLPYNCFDEHAYRRDFSYWKEFDLAQLDGKSVLLRFEGFMAQADIYLNGVKLGHFISLYFPVGIDVTSAARVGKNLLYVHLDADEYPGIPPFGGAIDYLTYAGIYRPVHLEVVPQSHFSSVFVKANAKGEVEVKCSLSGENGSIDYAIYDGDDLVMESTSPRFLVDSPRLWCPSDPHLYELRVSHSVNGEIEERRVRFGFRDVAWKEDGFYLNGKHMKLTGLNRHQSYPYIGYAAPARLQKEDALIMKRGGVDVVRTSHYLDGEAFLEACDEVGLLGDLTEDVGRVAHVGGGQLADGGLHVDLAELLELGVVRADLAQGLLEDGRVGGDTDHVLLGDELLQAAGLDAGAGQIVQPDRDAGVGRTLRCFSHLLFSF